MEHTNMTSLDGPLFRLGVSLFLGSGVCEGSEVCEGVHEKLYMTCCRSPETLYLLQGVLHPAHQVAGCGLTCLFVAASFLCL